MVRYVSWGIRISKLGEAEAAERGRVVLADELEDGRAGAADPLHVIGSEGVEPCTAVFGDDEREEIGDRIVIVGVG